MYIHHHCYSRSSHRDAGGQSIHEKKIFLKKEREKKKKKILSITEILEYTKRNNSVMNSLYLLPSFNSF